MGRTREDVGRFGKSFREGGGFGRGWHGTNESDSTCTKRLEGLSYSHSNLFTCDPCREIVEYLSNILYAVFVWSNHVLVFRGMHRPRVGMMD